MVGRTGIVVLSMIMAASALGARRRANVEKRGGGRVLTGAPGLSFPGAAAPGTGLPPGNSFSFVDLGDSARVVLMLTPKGRGSFGEQARELLATLPSVLERQPVPMTVTSQTVFLADAGHRAECERILAAHFRAGRPVTNFVLEPPCGGAALAMEIWAIGGKSVRIEHFGPHALTVTYDGVRWVYCAGIETKGASRSVFAQATEGLERMSAALKRAGSGFEHVVRTWFYLGGITELEGEVQRYTELNRARTDFYRNIHFCASLLNGSIAHRIFPASTGIGMTGAGLVMGCITLHTNREDVVLLPLENPGQTPAYDYGPRYSPESPKFSRAMALVLGNSVTTWVSGTASITDSETRYVGDVEKQTELTIDNIERLIAPANFSAHGVKGAGAQLTDLAKVRVYVKRREDFLRCKAVCERRFGAVPAIYLIADVCRPELLVEIEGVAFSRRALPAAP